MGNISCSCFLCERVFSTSLHQWDTIGGVVNTLPPCPSAIYTSAKIIQLNAWGCRDGMHYVKNRVNKVIPLAILSGILAQSCVTPLP